ncbi:MAG TPA: carboxypeptidase regulatory-like domain-containing protein, partial [Vicinamibacteria bacterium]
MSLSGRAGHDRRRGFFTLVAALAGVWLLAGSALAQQSTGSILGHVKDSSGATVPGAQVTATNLGTQFSRATTSDAEGRYSLPLLPLGQYKVEVTLAGFKNFSQTGILLEVGRNVRVDPVIEPGEVTEQVSVVADIPLVETSSAALSRAVGQNEVLNLPLVNRDLYSLLSITGGVARNENSNSLGGPEQLTNINGSSAAQIGSVNFQLDGGNNTAGLRGTGNPAPNPEAVQEFRVITNGYGAEYGRYQAGIVDIVTKSGTNEWHGSAFGYFRDESLNAERWAPPGVTATKDPLDRKQYGAAFGGPIRKDKTFFFVSYAGLRQEETYYRNTARVPTALERQGNFSQSAQRPRDPLTGQPFPGGIIPPSRFDRAALTIQDRFVPNANLPNNFFEVSAPDPLETDEATFKLDHNLAQDHVLALSYFYLKGTDTQPMSLTGNIPWVDRDFAWTQHNVNLSETWSVNPTTINQFRATYVRQFGGRINNPTTSLGDLNSNFTIQGDPTLPRLTVTGYFTGQTSIAGPDAGSNYYGVRDMLSLVRGKHSLKLGAEVAYESIVHDTLLDNY